MPTKKVMTSDIVSKAIGMYRANMTFAEVARKLGVSESAVRRNLRGKVASRRCGKPFKVTGLNAEEAALLYKSGVSSRKIAEKMGVHRMTILRCLAAHGVDTSRNRSKGKAAEISRNMLSIKL